ncbi:MAG TPA: hypothetical protein VFS41_03855, partial [Edaphobacter sp.]|nr:hypothetical protein [Edaphobacter sp.]
MKFASALSASIFAACLLPLSANLPSFFNVVPNWHSTVYAAADDGFGPLDASPPSGITVDEIVKRIGQRESEFNRARENYIFRQSVKIQTISDDTGKPDGEY